MCVVLYQVGSSPTPSTYIRVMNELKIEKLNINDLTPYKGNAKEHPVEQIEQICKSIQEFNFSDPVAIWGPENIIVEGHGRLIAAKRLGMQEIPVIRLDHLTDEQRRAYTLAHNKLTMNSGFDLELLTAELDDIYDIDMSDFGFDDLEIEELEPEAQEDDYNGEPPAEPKSKPGDIYQLGRHRLMCGDATNIQHIDKLLDGVTADLVLTDPPYGIDANKMTLGTGARKFNRGHDWDKETPDIAFLSAIAKYCCIWGGNYFADQLPVTNDWLCWWKKNDGLSFSEFELAWSNFKCNCRIYPHHWGNEKKLHPTMKPISVMGWCIKKCPDNPQHILDCFGGSGSTLIACEQMNRNCYMIELDPAYVDVIIDRWEKFTGKTAKLLGDK